LAFDLQTLCTEYVLKIRLAPNIKFVYWRLSYSLSVLSMTLKYDLRQVNKLLLWHLKCSLSLLIMGSKLYLCQIK